MSSAGIGSRIRLRPRSDAIHVSRGRTVLAMGHEGTIGPEISRQGLYVYQTRMLSRYRWTIEGEEPQLSVQSPVEQHSWLAYYYTAPPNCKETPAGECAALQEAIGLKISRVVGEGMHEDIEVTNHTQVATSIELALEVEADFAAREEVRDGRKQHGRLHKQWKNTGDGQWQWSFDYRCDRRTRSAVFCMQRSAGCPSSIVWDEGVLTLLRFPLPRPLSVFLVLVKWYGELLHFLPLLLLFALLLRAIPFEVHQRRNRACNGQPDQRVENGVVIVLSPVHDLLAIDVG